MTLSVNRRAIIFVVATCFAGFASWWWGGLGGEGAVELFIFYAVLIIHSFFSLSFLDKIMPDSGVLEQTIDIILFLFYLGMAFSFNMASIFIFLGISMFTLATLKYILLSKQFGQFRINLREKIRANCLGISLLLIVLAGVIGGYRLLALRTLVLTYIAATIYYLFIHQIYKEEGTGSIIHPVTARRPQV
ncbi:MAG: hypothetical protein A3H71_03680 [Candidatus Sungbacteria bacterium RIFCSPLOWO2_02_FULL_48_13b]|uniref:Uncharacterized protein n=2 Tax=Candidatus Sungiibacteriota TaxID=1817917 RepID=A0A1G2LDH1_9BACT|nr:MAG: hypothetical protein A3C12_00285 [Candidatus Sungbacteria bacterium RIFCSPHIGHO2_02_FULL_49_20]OHA09685.1 MAG: hypothetical protein A3H71_03680 [Candidatus Sungbacteria bacterium RIFCSPLOWO2_02_FULL_48_13b]